jgi:hypothetical protein
MRTMACISKAFSYASVGTAASERSCTLERNYADAHASIQKEASLHPAALSTQWQYA